MRLKIQRRMRRDISEQDMFIVHLPQVPVNWDRTFDEAVQISGPNTPSDHPIWKAGKEYPKPDGKAGIGLTDFSLIGYDRPWNIPEAMGYLDKRCLTIALAQEVFAIGEAYSTELAHLWINQGFHYRDSIGAVSLQSSLNGEVRLPGIWFYSRGCLREAGFHAGRYSNDIWIAVLGLVS